MLNRRTLLKGSVAASAMPLAHLSGVTPISKEGYIDSHVHVWTPDIDKYPLDKLYTKDSMQPPSFTPEQLMAHAKPTGVSKVVLIQMSYYGYDNSYMLDVMKKFPGVYSGVAVIDQNDKPAETMKQMKEKGVRGFRIRPGNKKQKEWLVSKEMKAMWTTAADENLNMCHLIDPVYLRAVHRMCADFKKTPVVIDHFARLGVDGKIRQGDLFQLCRLSKYENVYIKVSAFYALGKKKAPYHDFLPIIKRLVAEYGSDRLMWGSDCPFQVVGGHKYAPSIDLIKNEKEFLSDKDKENILRNTAQRVFFS